MPTVAEKRVTCSTCEKYIKSPMATNKWFYQYDKQAGRMERISIKDFKDKSVERDHGEGKQIYVSTKYFEPVKMPPVKKWIKQVELVA